ncbi:MAG: carbonate dehydratase [Desulfobulbaceae bacterium]|nr:carbonate dehydratase [Desulfobulbaceae bacterium]
MAIEKNTNGDYPEISRSAFIHQTAVLIGNIVVGKNVFIGPYAVIRADEPTIQKKVMPIIIGDGVNIQDGVIIHALAGSEVRVDSKTSLAHGALIHGPALIGRNCFIGFKSIVFRATVGDGSIVMHNSLVENCVIPNNCSIPSSGSIRSDQDLHNLIKVDKKLRAFADTIILTNINLALQYTKRGN